MAMRCRFYQPLSAGGSVCGPCIHRHDIVEGEVRAVLAHPGEELPAFGGARMALGQIRPGERYLRVVYVPDPEPGSAFVLAAFTLRGEALRACRVRQRGWGRHRRPGFAGEAPARDPEPTSLPEGQFPPGWDEERVRRVVAHYEQLDPAAQLAEDEAALEQLADQ